MVSVSGSSAGQVLRSAGAGLAPAWATLVPADIAGGAPLASPTFTGTPSVPTAAVDTSTTQAASTQFVLSQAASVAPQMNGSASAGTATRFARADHVHASDTSRAPLASPTFTGSPAAPNAAVGTATTQLATCAFVANTLAARSKVASRNSGAQSIPNNTATVVTGWANVIDTGGEFNAATGTFTATAAGNYLVSAQLSFNGAMAVGSLLQLQLFANGSNFVSGQVVVQNATPTTNVVILPSYLVALAAGQTIQIKALQSSGAAVPLVASASSNFLSITASP